MANEGKIKLSDRNIVISQTTRYPWDGQVQITVTPEKAMLMTLCLRIPGWARNEALPGGLYRFADTCSESPALFLNGKMRPFQMKNGYALITKTWKPGDMVSLSLPLPVRKVLASDEVKDDKDKVALTRGPIVFCGEGIDNNDTVKDLVIPVTSTFTYTFESDLLNGVGTLQGNVFRLSGDGFDQPVTKHPASLILHPYYSWCHRGAGKMNVWFYTNRYVFPPEMKPANSLFLDEIRIRMKQYQGQEIHYTTGDNYPDKQASLYHDQVVITETTSISAIAYDSENRPSDLIYGNFSQGILFPASTPDSAKQGLICTYYEGRFRRLPDFDTLTPLKSTIVADVNAYTGRDTTDAYALEFEGFLEFPVNGIYDLYVASDDGGRILIDDREVVINDGLHELSEQTGQTAVYKGTHPIRIQFFDYGGEEGLMLSISGPGLPKQRIPKEWYSH